MAIVLITESSFGRHHKIENENVKLISTKGSSIIKLRGNGYKVSESFLAKVASYNPSFVLIGTDLDLQGTKIATLLHHSLKSMGIKNFRFALTEKGYMRVGEFLSDKRLQAIFLAEKANIEFAKKMRKNFGVSVGRKTFFLLGTIQHFRRTKPIVKNINPNGSNTITAITKMVLGGRSVSSAVMKLQNLYYQGKIPYPRVDNDYILEKPYELYPHPNLREYGYKADVVMPLERNSYRFNYKTLWLQLCNERLITPSTVLYYDNQLNKFFWNKETLKPYKIYEPIFDIAEEFYLASKDSYRKELESVYHPQLLLSEPRPLSSLKKKSEFELLEMFEEMENSLKKNREENNQPSEEEIWKKYRKIEKEFDREIKKSKFKGLSP